ncbi:MAG: wax ester/triacylglycerol synthase family O-acyltransferase [Mycobacterium sp.]
MSSKREECIRLSGYDTWFVVDEPVEPQHTLKIAVFDEESSRAFDVEEVISALGAAVAVLPQMRWRLRPVPLGINRPMWVVASNFNVRDHVRFTALPGAGDKKELCRLIGEIAAQQIPSGKPPWQLWFITGFEGAKVVAMLKLSHALADGGTCAQLISMLSRPEPNAPPVRALVPQPCESATWRDLVHQVARELLREVPRLVNVMRKAKIKRRKPVSQVKPPSMVRAPPLPWRGPLTAGRSFSYVTIPLPEVKAVGRTVGGTVNDVVFACVAGAVRSYLAERNELTDRPVVATTVAKNRRESDPRLWGNAVTTRVFGLPTHIADPLERLKAAQAQSNSVKARVAHRRGAQLEEWIDLVPPMIMRPVSAAIRRAYRAYRRSSGYVMVSNVVGPREKRYIGGLGVENFISSGHLKYAAGVNVTVWSYDGKLNFAVYGCSETLADADEFSERVHSAFDELQKATSGLVPDRRDKSASGQSIAADHTKGAQHV